MGRFKNLEIGQNQPESTVASGQQAEAARDERFYLAEADAARRQGFYENGLRYFSRVLEFNKSLIEAWVGQVRMLVEMAEYPEAVLWSGKALELFRENPDLMAGKAQAMVRRGDVPNALACSDGAVQKSGESAYRWLVRGELMVATRQRTDAYLFDKAALADPDWIVLLDVARVYLYYNEPARAVTWARRAVEKSPTSTYASLVEGRCHAKSRNQSLARQCFERSLELAPNHREAEDELRKLGTWSWGALLRRYFGAS